MSVLTMPKVCPGPTPGEAEPINLYTLGMLFVVRCRYWSCRAGNDPGELELAAATDAYSGADIEQVVNTGLKLAFHVGKSLKTEHLFAATPEVRPLSQTDPERVDAMTAWLERHTKPASTRDAAAGSAKSNGMKRNRKVSL